MESFPARAFQAAAVALLAAGSACSSGGSAPEAGGERDPRLEMRSLVERLSAKARAERPGFLVIPQNGEGLLAGEGEPEEGYLAAIDGQGREDLFYGYTQDDVPTPAAAREEMLSFLEVAQGRGLRVLVTDYCFTPEHVDDSYRRNAALGHISFAADRRELDDIPEYPPEPFAAHREDVSRLAQARNFLYLIDPEAFGSRSAYLGAIRATDYDLLILDAFYEGEILTAEEVAALRDKDGGGRRIVVAYLCVGEAEDYRYYWQETWRTDPPIWLLEENPRWPGNYRIRYWDPAWQEIIFAGADSYLDRVLDAGFDGVYLDLVDAFESFEDK